MAGLVIINVFFILNSSREGSFSSSEPIFNSTQAYVLPISEPSYFPILDSAKEKPVIGAKASLVYDTRSGRYLFTKNPRARLPIASLTKVLSATVVLENLDLKETIKIPKEVVRVDKEKQSLYLDEEITVQNLLKLMLIESSNDAAYALAHYADSVGVSFVDKMNEKAQTLGMIDSLFIDPAGLNDEAYSTVEDLVKLVKYSLKHELIWDILTEKSITVRSTDGKIEHNLENTNQLLGVIPDMIGGKTGHTNNASGCMILVIDIPGKNDKIVSIVLGTSSRFDDTKKLIDWVKESYRWE